MRQIGGQLDDLDAPASGNGSCPLVDMGSYEFPTTCPPDFNCDEDAGVTDLVNLLFNWGPCSACAADIDGDGEIDIRDLLMLLAAWGPCV